MPKATFYKFSAMESEVNNQEVSNRESRVWTCELTLQNRRPHRDGEEERNTDLNDNEITKYQN